MHPTLRRRSRGCSSRPRRHRHRSRSGSDGASALRFAAAGAAVGVADVRWEQAEATATENPHRGGPRDRQPRPNVAGQAAVEAMVLTASTHSWCRRALSTTPASSTGHRLERQLRMGCDVVHARLRSVLRRKHAIPRHGRVGAGGGDRRHRLPCPALARMPDSGAYAADKAASWP